MEDNEIKAIEDRLITENEHWNNYMFDILCEAISKEEFENYESLLFTFDVGIGIVIEHTQTPVYALKVFDGLFKDYELSGPQQVFVLEWVIKYVQNTDFSDLNLSKILKVIDCRIQKLKSEHTLEKPKIKDIREMLKDLIYKELVNLPQTLESLEPVQRLNILSKMIPFVLPKVETVHSEKDEPGIGGLALSD